jgi:hypothetical protein
MTRICSGIFDELNNPSVDTIDFMQSINSPRFYLHFLQVHMIELRSKNVRRE